MSHSQNGMDACQKCAIACERCLNALIDMNCDDDCPHFCRQCMETCHSMAA
ncbi:hypothetical protein [Rubripirellula obstinata]|uniref:hypothetical protein n=1 Tax=Rubripirellula obstinata TaxID=406547 RepID=UPI0013901CA5|nr:hypothetical protein [Rubripirellula obstinata]